MAKAKSTKAKTTKPRKARKSKAKSAKALPAGAKPVTIGSFKAHCYTKRIKNAKGSGSHTRAFCRKDAA